MATGAIPDRDEIMAWLEEVHDPEIPVLSLPDLGVIRTIAVDGDAVSIEITPTFVGCPAMDVMQADIRQCLAARGVDNVTIRVNYEKPWTSERISEKGREALRNFGIAPPPATVIEDLFILEDAVCPRCGGTDTETRNIFGSTLCRSIHYCNHCLEAFEQFKPLRAD